jgi:hypothetical protein
MDKESLIPVYQQIVLLNETDLHCKVVGFMRKYFPNCIIVPGLGELQFTPDRRIASFRKGYTAGQPDLLILNSHKQYTGFAIELKTPKGHGRVSDNQQAFLEDLQKAGWKTLVSNDYDEIVMELIRYFEEVRFKCQQCTRAFKTRANLQEHEDWVHAKKRKKGKEHGDDEDQLSITQRWEYDYNTS